MEVKTTIEAIKQCMTVGELVELDTFIREWKGGKKYGIRKQNKREIFERGYR